MTTPHDCCAPSDTKPTPPVDDAGGGRGFLFGLGSIMTAVVASACCWLPLALIGLGASATGVGAAFEAWRPYLLGLTAILLAAGFWYAYRPQSCAPGSACATVPVAKRRRLRRTLWIVTALALISASFPWYAPALVRATAPATPPAVAQSNDTSLTIAISGMTCSACAVNLERSLASVPGVHAATVSYDTAQAIVHWDPGTTDPQTLESALRHAIAAEGYQGGDVVMPGR